MPSLQANRNKSKATVRRRFRTTHLLWALLGLCALVACLVIGHSLRLTNEAPSLESDRGIAHTDVVIDRQEPNILNIRDASAMIENQGELKPSNNQPLLLQGLSGGERRTQTDAGVVGLDDPDLYKTVDLQGDSSTATVMGMASGYGLSVYQRFVGSLRKAGFQGNVILGVAPDVDPKILAYFRYRRVTPKILKWVNCTYQSTDPSDKTDIFARTTCSHPYPDIKIRWSRFPLQRDWLSECQTCTGPVLVMDVRDAYFQLDPFGPGSGPISGLQVFEEHPSQTTAHWLVKPIVQKCKGVEFVKPMLCSGTTIGTRAAMLKYLEIMYEEMKVWISTPTCRFNLNGDDQTIHNYLYYTGQLPFATAIPNRYGIVNTVGVEGSKIFKEKRKRYMDAGMPQGDAGAYPYDGATATTWIGPQYNVADESGMFTQHDGKTRSRVIHQFDRYGVPFLNWMSKQNFLHDIMPADVEAENKLAVTVSSAVQEVSPTLLRTHTDADVDVSDPALYEAVDLNGDSSTATVMGMATGYPLSVYKRFVGSLRKSGFRGNIILGVAPDVPNSVLDYFRSRDVEWRVLKWVNCTYRTDDADQGDIFKKTHCSHPYPDIKIRWSRFPLQRDWLERCERCTGPVLIMDVRDSYFQLDPFGPGSGPITGLQVFEEHPSQTTGHWLVKPIVEKCKNVSFIKPMVSAN